MPILTIKRERTLSDFSMREIAMSGAYFELPLEGSARDKSCFPRLLRMKNKLPLRVEEKMGLVL